MPTGLCEGRYSSGWFLLHSQHWRLDVHRAQQSGRSPVGIASHLHESGHANQCSVACIPAAHIHFSPQTSTAYESLWGLALVHLYPFCIGILFLFTFFYSYHQPCAACIYCRQGGWEISLRTSSSHEDDTWHILWFFSEVRNFTLLDRTLHCFLDPSGQIHPIWMSPRFRNLLVSCPVYIHALKSTHLLSEVSKNTAHTSHMRHVLARNNQCFHSAWLSALWSAKHSLYPHSAATQGNSH